MKIVTFSEKFWPEGSGGELATYLILKLLASTGDFEIEVYTGTRELAKVPGVSIKPVGFLRASNKIQLFANILMNKHYVEKAIKNADIVYVPRFSYPVILLAKKLKKKVVVHLHDYQPISYTSVILSTETSKPLNDFKRTLLLESMSGSLLRAIASTLATPSTRIIRKWVNLADKIICVSKKHKEVLLKFAPEYKEKVIVVYNPPPELPNVQNKFFKRPTLLYVGGENYVKGFHVLLESLKTLGMKGIRNFELILANKYSRKTLMSIEKLRNLYNLDIKVVGRIPHSDLIKLYSVSWCLLFPSICEEPLPYAVMEAMLLNTIPISSRVGGVVELVEGTIAQNFLFNPGEWFELAEKVEQVVKLNVSYIRDMSLELRNHVLSKIDTRRITKEIVAQFNCCINHVS